MLHIKHCWHNPVHTILSLEGRSGDYLRRLLGRSSKGWQALDYVRLERENESASLEFLEVHDASERVDDALAYVGGALLAACKVSRKHEHAVLRELRETIEEALRIIDEESLPSPTFLTDLMSNVDHALNTRFGKQGRG